MALTALQSLRLIELLGAICVVLSSLEFLLRPRLIDDASLMSWPLFRLRHPWFIEGAVGGALDRVLAYPTVFTIIAARLAAATFLVVGVEASVPHLALLATVALTTSTMMLRTTFGLEGSDQVVLLLFVTLTLIFVHPSPIVIDIGLWFIALQTALAYFTSGIYKITSRTWLDGSALVGIFGTQAYGHPAVARLLALHPQATTWLSRLFCAAECAFPLVLVLPASALPPFLVGGLLFHLCCAFFMGLNNFLWAFVAMYPAVAFCVLSR